MGRVRENIEINGQKVWTLFDSGARNTYVTEKVAKLLPTFEFKKPEPVALGGEVHKIIKDCRLECVVEGLPVRAIAWVLNQIGKDEDGKEIEVIIGALTMQQWGIKLDLENEKLDMSHYPKEFVEF